MGARKAIRRMDQSFGDQENKLALDKCFACGSLIPGILFIFVGSYDCIRSNQPFGDCVFPIYFYFGISLLVFSFLFLLCLCCDYIDYKYNKNKDDSFV